MNGYDVVSVKAVAAGIDDGQVLKKAFEEDRVLITHDKGFGERVFKNQEIHHGIILLRVMHLNPQERILILSNVLSQYKQELQTSFIVASDNSIRVVEQIFH
jgi:predicted nuclease of predicted toxin-antitoxin system